MLGEWPSPSAHNPTAPEARPPARTGLLPPGPREERPRPRRVAADGEAAAAAWCPACPESPIPPPLTLQVMAPSFTMKTVKMDMFVNEEDLIYTVFEGVLYVYFLYYIWVEGSELYGTCKETGSIKDYISDAWNIADWIVIIVSFIALAMRLEFFFSEKVRGFDAFTKEVRPHWTPAVAARLHMCHGSNRVCRAYPRTHAPRPRPRLALALALALALVLLLLLALTLRPHPAACHLPLAPCSTLSSQPSLASSNSLSRWTQWHPLHVCVPIHDSVALVVMAHTWPAAVPPWADQTTHTGSSMPAGAG